MQLTIGGIIVVGFMIFLVIAVARIGSIELVKT